MRVGRLGVQRVLVAEIRVKTPPVLCMGWTAQMRIGGRDSETCMCSPLHCTANKKMCTSIGEAWRQQQQVIAAPNVLPSNSLSCSASQQGQHGSAKISMGHRMGHSMGQVKPGSGMQMCM